MALTAYNQSLIWPIQEPSDVGESRRRVVSLAHRLHISQAVRDRLAVIVQELAHNAVRHADRGELIVRAVEKGGVSGIELLAVDHGPGMTSISQCMRDGYSTIGTSGTGLGALKRLADLFDIYSQPGEGTIILVRVYAEQVAATAPTDLDVGAVCVPASFETACGDAWAMRRHEGGVEILVADGLGHGPDAAEAAAAAVECFEQSRRPVVQLLPQMHERMRRTRGGAVAISRLNLPQRTLEFWCVGNISGAMIHGDRQQQLASQHGTLGAALPQLQSFAYPLPPGAALVMHSDGLTTRWRLAGNAMLSRHHPGIVAGWLYRNYRRGRDDLSVVLTKIRR